MAETSASADDSPVRAGPTRVRGNRWQELAVPRLGQWAPAATVTVVVPCYESADELRLTLAALSQQTYPPELLQVIVVDDGSTEPVKVSDDEVPGDVRVIRLERSGFGAGRARQAGADAAEGEVVLFLDADIVADPAHVEAHARWHHLTDDAATMGVRTFVDFDGIDADAIRSAAASDGIDALLRGRRQQPHEWVENYLASTDDLREHRGDEWRIVVGASLGVRRALLRELGGLPSFGVRGTEDTVLGYRLFTRGAVLVPDREARSWHQGPRTLEDPKRKAEVLRQREPILVNEIADKRFREPAPGRSYVVPSMVVTVPVDASTRPDEAVECVSAVLASELHDLVVGVTGPADAPARDRAARMFAGDPRVEVTDEAAWVTSHPHSPFRITIPPHAVVSPLTLGRVRAKLAGHELGALHVTVPGSSPDHGLVHAVTTRALRRAERAAAPGEDVEALVGELFGERWDGGEDYTMDSTHRTGEEEAERIRDGRYAGWRAPELAARLQEVERQLGKVRQRRIFAILTALSRAQRGPRDPRSLYAAAKDVLRAVIRKPSHPA